MSEVEDLFWGVKKEIAATAESIFLTASVPDYFDTQHLCTSMLDSVIERVCMGLNANQIYEIEKLCTTGADKESLMEKFDIEAEKIDMVQKVVDMKVKCFYLQIR